MKILGCDCSTKLIGCSMLSDDGIIKLTTLLGGDSKDNETRAYKLYGLIKELLDTWKPDRVYIEQAVYLQNVKVTLTIDSVVNGVKYACIDKGITYWIIDNKSWKKDVLGNGNSSKEDIAKFAKMKWGEVFKTQDEMDAACLAFYGWRRI